MTSVSRRAALKLIGLGTTVGGLPVEATGQPTAAAGTDSSTGVESVDDWGNRTDRVWLGEAFWANPMEDWQIVDGGAECRGGGGNRNIHLLTHELTDPTAPLEMSVELMQTVTRSDDGGAGFKLGIHSEIQEYRSNCFANNGLIAGLVGDQLVLAGKRQKVKALPNPLQVKLTLKGQPVASGYELTLAASEPSGQLLGKITTQVSAEQVLGNVALVSNFRPGNKYRGAGYRFQNWIVSGAAFSVDETRKFGPILWSMYSLSDSRTDEGFVLKLTALTGPVGLECQPRVELSVESPQGWKSLGEVVPDSDAWTATFRIPHWDANRKTPFRLTYRETGRDGEISQSERTGIIQANPTGRPLKIGALTCQNDYAFPYAPVAENLLKLDPDLLYFSGDQLYENHGGYGVVRAPAEPAILNYLRKFYQFGWAFGEAMRDRPTLCIPDDHDVFHGNLWGEGGKQMVEGTTSSAGGYIQPARMVNVVHKTCVSHHPDFADSTPVEQDISVYYGDMVYGGVGFAIIADRQWKSGPEHVDTGPGRADHVLEASFDTSTLDQPDLILLGDRQEEFLTRWAEDWRGHTMKVLLSQTVFSGLATHHGGYDGYLKADLDSGAWPQTARNRTLRLLQKAKSLHINGDQHLTTLSQYGIDRQRDSFWAFCTPAIAVGYPRWWRPDELQIPHEHRPQHGLADTGEYLDSFGNKSYVYAVGNPEVGTAPHRYEKAHQKGSGFGVVTIDLDKKTYFIESYRFLIDVNKAKADNQFPGWPVTIHQQENGGENLLT